MGPDRAAPLVSINLPCYRQPEYARACIAALLDQTLADFELTLLDDASSPEYAALAAAFGDPRVRHRPNPERLGAMLNMFQAIGYGTGRYCFAFHEDDLVSRGYLAAAVAVLEANPGCAFVAAEIREFPHDGLPATDELGRVCDEPEVTVLRSAADFLRAIFRGVEPMFGSVVYRRAALADARAEHERFATLVDRPFLLSMLDRWSCAIIRAPQMAWYRPHVAADARHLPMTADHVLHLFERYRSLLPTPLGRDDRALYHAYAGYWLPTLCDLVAPDRRRPIRRVLVRALRSRLYDLRWAWRYGRKRLIRAALFPGSTA